MACAASHRRRGLAGFEEVIDVAANGYSKSLCFVVINTEELSQEGTLKRRGGQRPRSSIFTDYDAVFNVPWPADLNIGFQVVSRHIIMKFYYSMNSYDFEPNVILDSSCFPPLSEVPFASEASSLCGFGYSVQMLDIHDCGYLDQQAANQGAHSSRQDGNSIDDLDETMSSFPGVNPIYDTSLLPTNSHQTDHQLSLLQSSDTVSEPSLPFMPGSLNNNTLSHTDPVQCEATGSACSVEPFPLLLEEVTASCLGRMRIARSRAKYAKSARGKLTQARIQARYVASPSGRASRARVNAKYSASEKAKKSRARYNTSVKGQVTKAIKNIKSRAYRSGLKQGLSDELAREKGNQVARKKRAQLASVLIPGFSVKDR